MSTHKFEEKRRNALPFWNNKSSTSLRSSQVAIIAKNSLENFLQRIFHYLQ